MTPSRGARATERRKGTAKLAEQECERVTLASVNSFRKSAPSPAEAVTGEMARETTVSDSNIRVAWRLEKSADGHGARDGDSGDVHCGFVCASPATSVS